MPSLYIAIPAYGGLLYADFAMALFNLVGQLSMRRIPAQIDIVNDAMVCLARNLLANRFLRSSATHLLFVDADVVSRPADVLSMLAAQKDVIALPCSKKTLSGEPALNLLNGVTLADADMTSPLEVKSIGTGVMLIAREVLQRIAAAHPERTLSDGREHVFFNTGIDPDTREWLPEDYAFCRDWRELGGKVFCLPSAVTVHIGRHGFGCNLAANPDA